MTFCVILHNMIVEDEGDGVAQTHDFEAPGEQVKIPEDHDATQLMHFLQMGVYIGSFVVPVGV